METLQKSPRDNNIYDLFKLENGVTCLLIQDQNSKAKKDSGGNMASVSIAINAGSFNDPPSRQGLAHFLEHMIFMGSEKYPDENAFNSLISANGGYSNAYTENEHTNYQFKINYSELKLALDMKAHLLYKPLLKKEAQLREIQAVDSEFEGNFSYDNVRAELILSESIEDKEHPCAQFGWGNLMSLTAKGKETLWNDLKSFYEEQYSADRTYLVIQSKNDIKEIRSWVTESFGILPNKNLGKQNF